MTREELLQKAAETVCGSREQAHGNPHKILVDFSERII